jgi:hypothetical protein
MSRLVAAIPPVFGFERWHEDQGDVLWHKYPITEPPYCGTPLDLGRAIRVTVDGKDYQQDVGGWPYHEDDEPYLFWYPLPSGSELNRVMRVMSLQSNEKE